MNKLNEIISAIKKPLSFASRHQFANLDTVKKLEYHLHTLAEEALSLPLDTENKALFQKLLDCVDSFDSLNNEGKKERIENVLTLLSKIKGGETTDPCAWKRLSTPIQFVKGVGPRISELLGKKGIHTVGDALYFLPRRYEDRREIKKIAAITTSAIETVRGNILMLDVVPYMKGRKRIFEMAVSDGTGTVIAKWFHFNERYMKKRFSRGQQVIISGEVKLYRFQKEIHHP